MRLAEAHDVRVGALGVAIGLISLRKKSVARASLTGRKHVIEGRHVERSHSRAQAILSAVRGLSIGLLRRRGNPGKGRGSRWRGR